MFNRYLCHSSRQDTQLTSASYTVVLPDESFLVPAPKQYIIHLFCNMFNRKDMLFNSSFQVYSSPLSLQMAMAQKQSLTVCVSVSQVGSIAVGVVVPQST